MIVTLAGHVDHGKTSLVRALSGVDTDRLEQEKLRGLTIDLGFAYIDDGDIGFVDVPGHARFIHNMVAGIASQQFALLVVAADDGPMPQTREHLDILRLIGLRSGAIAITKSDRVDAQRLKTCRAEVATLVADTFLEAAPVFVTSAEDPESTKSLLEHLRAVAGTYTKEIEQKPFRMAIDRAFSIKGAGLVVTGTVHSGVVSADDTLFHFPSGDTVRVRSIRAQDQDAEQAIAGDRCALNISGLNVQDVARGHWLDASPMPAQCELTIGLKVLDTFPRAVAHWTPVHVYNASSHATGRIALLGQDRVAPGQREMIDLVCDQPLTARHGDQLIVRDQSLDVTLGGGAVIFAHIQPSARRRNPERLKLLQAFDAESPRHSLENLLGIGPVNISEFLDIWHLLPEDFDKLLSQHDVLKVSGMAVTKELLGRYQKQLLEQVTQHQAEQASSPGLKENAFIQIPALLRQRLLNAMVQAEVIENVGGFFRLPDQQTSLPPELKQTWAKLEPKLDQLQPPSTGDLAKQTDTPQVQIEKDLKALSKRGFVVHIAVHRFYLPNQLKQVTQHIHQLAAEKPFTVKEFRDKTGIGRNVAIEVLEYFDGRGFTRRQGNERIVLKADY
ncbi:MAG: selenocysteine-specific translation elongation factor [Pseudomonadaceae bacterium]|nr:selenocysteine-specific translation elongation factor [Pseudomonadaceae bacterium]